MLRRLTHSATVFVRLVPLGVMLSSCSSQVPTHLDVSRQVQPLSASAQGSYRRIAAASADKPSAYVAAWRICLQRYRGAVSVGDTEAMARQFTAIGLYEKRIADSLVREAEEQERQVRSMPTDDAQALVAQQAQIEKDWHEIIRRNVISADQRQKLIGVGLTEAQVSDLAMALDTISSKQPPKLKGPRAALLDLADMNKALADSWRRASEESVTAGAERHKQALLRQTYTVGNPHDKEENVDLLIRPISIPLDWKLSITNAQEPQTQEQPPKQADNSPKYPVREVEAGKHYAVSLPAKAQVKVASVLIPVGEIGAHTTARWAVEGKIGDELIGGMVHEMNVPYIIADLQLPPVGSKEVEEELPAPSRPWVRLAAELAAGIAVLALLAYFFIVWRKRRQAHSA